MKKSRKLFSTVVSIGLIVAMTGTSVLATVSDEKDKLSGLNEQKQEAESKHQQLENSKAEAQEYIKSIDNKLTKLSKEIYDTEQSLAKTEKQIEKTTKRMQEAEDSISVQYDDMKLRIKYMYENGDTQMIDLLLNSKNISDFLNKAEYITELSQYDRKMLDKLKETKKEIADAKKSLEKDKKSLVTLQEQQARDKANLEKLSADKQKELEGYEEAISHNEDTADALEAEIQAQEKRVAAAEEASKAAEEASKAAEANKNNNNNNNNNNIHKPVVKPSKPTNKYGYTWPLPGYTYVSSDFGYRSDPFTGVTAYHSGIDMPAPSGTPIVAAATGTVEWATYSATAGNWIGINHGNGVYTVYMHMSALLVSAGTRVSAGQTIGLVGTTGSSTGNHLHFSVRKNGAYVSPWGYVSK